MRIAIGARRASVHLGLLAGVALAVALAAQALDPSRAYVLVQLRPSGAAAARAAGATVVSRRLSIWRVSPARATALGRAGLVELSEPDRRLAAAGAAAGPASSEGWWLTAVGADPA